MAHALVPIKYTSVLDDVSAVISVRSQHTCLDIDSSIYRYLNSK